MDREIGELLARHDLHKMLREARIDPDLADPPRDLLLERGYPLDRVKRALTPYAAPKYEWCVATGAGVIRLFHHRDQARRFRNDYLRRGRTIDYARATKPRVAKTDSVSNTWASSETRDLIMRDVSRVMAGQMTGASPPAGTVW
jgi:hypothetical protein